MSYRAVWGKIRATEKRLGQPLLYRKTGGPQGGGSQLTPFGEKILERFEELLALTRNAADELFRDIFMHGLHDEHAQIMHPAAPSRSERKPAPVLHLLSRIREKQRFPELVLAKFAYRFLGFGGHHEFNESFRPFRIHFAEFLAD